MDTISFNARHIKNVTIAKKICNEYKPMDVALVKMNVNNKKDIDAIYRTTDEWDGSFTAFTYDDMKKAVTNKLLKDNIHIYALTTQKNNYRNLNHEKILGVAEVLSYEGNSNKLEVLQTNPLYASNICHKNDLEYKHIGNTLLDHVKSEHNDKDIYVVSVESAVNFYKNAGFKETLKGNSLVYKA